MRLRREDQARARRTDPDTSHQAAESVENIPRTQGQILAILLKDGPLIDEELCERHRQWYGGATDSSIRTRRSELVTKGFVEFAGSKGRTKAGGPSKRWAAVITGQES